MGQETYIWFSPATDVTGKKIQEALGASGGTAKPAGKETVLCWGAKTDADVVFGAGTRVINHPNKIRANRNKFGALKTMSAAKVNVAAHSDNFKAAGAGDFTFPLICRTNYHQGGAGFWLCLSAAHIAQAVKEGAQYMQKYIDIKDEYRLHVLQENVIYGVRKVQRDNHEEAFVEHFGELVENKAVKDAVNLDKATLTFALKKLAKKFATGADMIVRSNTRGWKFSKVANENLPKELVAEAVKAVKALGLDFAAVDCCMGTDGKVYIIECNSGPGLDGNSFDTWVAALKTLTAKQVEKPAAKPAAKAAGKVEAAAAVNAAAQVAGKNNLQKKLLLLAELAGEANDEEAAVLEKLLAKIK